MLFTKSVFSMAPNKPELILGMASTTILWKIPVEEYMKSSIVYKISRRHNSFERELVRLLVWLGEIWVENLLRMYPRIHPIIVKEHS